MSTYINSEVTPIGKLLGSDAIIKVPEFQRNYAWTDEEVKQLWQDIIEAMESSQKEYFLGPVVFKTTDFGYEVIDGQQRITTILLILSSIRKKFRENGDNNRADWFSNKFFGEKDIYTMENKPKFHMNEVNDPYFQQFIIADYPDHKIRTHIKTLLKKDSNYLLLQALLTINESIEGRIKEISSSEFSIEVLLGIHNFLCDQLQILLLTVKDEADAYVIFETLNDRGRGLNTMDLLKNHLFGHAKSYINQVKANWQLMRDTLSEIDPTEKFVYHFWTSKNGRTSKNNLFRIMRDDIGTSKNSLAFSKDILEGSKIYSALNISNHPFWLNHDQRTRNNLEVLKILDAQQALPILMAGATKFSPEEFSKLTQILVVMAIRYNLIGEQRTGVLANYYSEIPPKIFNSELTKAAKVFREVKPIYPNDSDFKDAFLKKSIRDSKKARYILTEIEVFLSNDITTIVNDPRKVNLEHILPRNPGSEWKETINSIPLEEQIEYTYKLGNLALMSSGNNKGLGAKGFQSKKEIFASEPIHFTKSISEYEVWTKETIEKRQEEMADVAVKVWKIDIS